MIFLLAFLSVTLSLFTGAEGKFKNGYFYEGHRKIGSVNDFFQFRTRPDLLAPRWKIKKHDAKALSPGYLFVAPYKKLSITKRGEAWIGPHIYDQDGELVWSGAPLFDHFKGFDIRLNNINGTEMLTAMYPHDNAAVVINKHYEIVETVRHSSDWKYSNMHDFNVVQNGTRALVLTMDGAVRMSREQSKAVGFDGECLVRGDGFKVLDMTKQPAETLMEWNGTNHIGLDETMVHVAYVPIEKLCKNGRKWDIHHMNSIDIFPDGDILVSARSTSTLYKVSQKTGEIVWRIGGKKSDFKLPLEARFNFQHHARVQSQNSTHVVISLLDNSKSDAETDVYTPRSHSAGIIISLNAETMEGRLIGEYPRPHGGYVRKRGSAHVLPNGHVFMGWAKQVRVSEHAADGRLLMEGKILPKLDSYRSYKFSWVGEPLEPPSVYSAAFVSGSTTRTMTYVSWNGATEVKKWKLYEVDVESGFAKQIAHARKKGFETAITYDGFAKYVVVEAVDANGKSLGKSRPVKTIPAVEEENVDLPTSGTLAHPANDVTEEKTSGASSAPDEEGSSWESSLKTTQIVAFVAALSGFAVCGSLFAFIWAMRNIRNSPWWRAQATKYEALPSNNQEDIEEEDGLEVGNEYKREGPD